MLVSIAEEAVLSIVARPGWWLPDCVHRGMQPSTLVSPARQNLRLYTRVGSFAAALLVLFIPPHALGTDAPSEPNESPKSFAFARYIASVEKRDPLKRSIPGPILI